jgi:alkylhydroperoxidase/carboxymuconolactone decarboxylase family protein YurZ
MDDKTKLEVGLQTRREVLGAEHVDRSLAQATDFARPMQELVTEYCWGAVWSRPGLDRKVRSLLNIVMLTAPQQYSVTSSCIGRAKSVACASERSTCSAPSTSRRV